MNVYIDEMFLINTITNFLLLTAAAKASGENLRFRRAVLAACMGGIYGIFMIFPNLKPYTGLFFRFAFSAVMLFAAFGKRKSFLKIFLAFYTAVFIFAGITVVFMNMGMRAVIYKGNLYFDFPAGGFILLSACLTFIINRIGAYFKKLLIDKGISCNIFIKYKDKTISAEGIFDTGNFLCDPISRKPVAVADIRNVYELFGETFVNAVKNGDYAAALSAEPSFLIPYSTVDRSGFLVAVKPDIFEINGKKVCALLGIANSGGSIIINPNITEVGVITK